MKCYIEYKCSSLRRLTEKRVIELRGLDHFVLILSLKVPTIQFLEWMRNKLTLDVENL
jgi:hypothetical protein